MGDIGQPSRFLALKYGAPWIYAAFNKERGIAPGLPSLDDFKTTYPVRAIAADTKVFGVRRRPGRAQPQPAACTTTCSRSSG